MSNTKKSIKKTMRKMGGLLKENVYNHEESELVKRFYDSELHIFGGYYDVKLVSSNCDSVLYHSTNAPLINEAMGLCNIHLSKLTDSFIDSGARQESNDVLASTRAWSWQQGARLSWFDQRIPSAIHYHDYCSDLDIYQSVIHCTKSNEVIARYASAFYDWNEPKGIYASLNWERLNHFRPGYGYSAANREAHLIEEKDDGLFLGQLSKNNSKLAFSLDELAFKVGFEAKNCYLNHLSFNKDGGTLLFFLIEQKYAGRKVAAFLLKLDSMDLVLLNRADSELPSHYAWGEKTLLLTVQNVRKNWEVREYSIENGDQLISSILEGINFDPHPVFVDEETILIDTPLTPFGHHKLFTFDIKSGNQQFVGRLYRPSIFSGPVRCDPHQRLHPLKRLAAVDTVYCGNRCLDVLKLKGK